MTTIISSVISLAVSWHRHDASELSQLRCSRVTGSTGVGSSPLTGFLAAANTSDVFPTPLSPMIATLTSSMSQGRCFCLDSQACSSFEKFQLPGSRRAVSHRSGDNATRVTHSAILKHANTFQNERVPARDHLKALGPRQHRKFTALFTSIGAACAKPDARSLTVAMDGSEDVSSQQK